MTSAIRSVHRELLDALFEDVIAGPRSSFLAFDLIRAVLATRDPQDLAVGALVDPESEVVILVRGNLQRIVVPWAWFRPTPDGTAPDFADAEIIDDGLTLRLGDYEAAVEAVLYEFDAAFRARDRRRRLASDESFGAALRRLRLQKGVARRDFPGVSEKTIARIERNEVDRPHGSTLHAIAARLGVDPHQIGTF